VKRPSDGLPHAARDLHLQIAIDGPSGAGKSTVGQAVARAFGCAFVDTGLMYRAATELALRRGLPLSDSRSLAALAESIDFRLGSGDRPVLLISGEPPGSELRTREVDAAVSEVSAHPEVRRIMLQQQRKLAAGRCVVMVGRDIGTVVLPDADIKLWITASPQERGRRRARENLADGASDQDEIASRIIRRDTFDAERAESPLRKAPDAVVIDTEHLEPSQALDAALSQVQSAIERRHLSIPHVSPDTVHSS
jgi:CMP/dCMP kinase